MVSRSILACLAACLALQGAPAAGQTEKPGASVPSEPVFAAVQVDGSTVSGRIRRLGPEGNVVLENDDEHTIALREVVKLSREGPAPPFPPEGTLALFPDGDRLRAVIGAAGETALETRSYILGDVSLPLDSLLGLVLAPPSEPEEFENLITKVREQPRKTEVVWMANGDRLTGGFLGLNARQLSFQPEGGNKVAIDRAQVVALGFDPKLVDYPRPDGAYFELTLTDGSRLGVTELKIEKGQVEAKARFGAALKLAIGDLARVHMRSPSVVYLSDRKADEAAYITYVGPARPYRRDAAVDGHSLRLGGQPYDHGIGTQSRTLLAYRLSAGDRRFQATVGLDDRAGPLGSVVFRVSLDGNDRFVSPPMSARDTPKAIDIDVSGAKVLILVTEFGERGDVRDFADWAEARLIR